MNSDLNKQAQTLETTFSRKIKSYHLQTGFSNILRIYLNEKLDFYHHIIERNAQTLIKKLTDINRCLTDPADRCLTNINRYYISYSTYPVLVILNQ